MTDHIKEAIERLKLLRKVGFGYDIKDEDRAAIDAVLSALAAAEERGRPQWQTIDTAPISNGSDVFLAHIVGHGACVCYAGAGRYIYSVQTGKRIHRATHWMPLPSPPAITKEPTP